MIPASEGGAMPGNIVKPSGCQTGECSLLGIGNPQRTTEREKEPRTLQSPSILPTRGKARAGFRSSTPGTAMAGTGHSDPPRPHSGSRGLVWKDGQLGIYGSLRPGSKEDTELSCTHVRAKLAAATPTPNSLPNSKNPALSPHSKTKHEALRCV